MAYTTTLPVSSLISTLILSALPKLFLLAATKEFSSASIKTALSIFFPSQFDSVPQLGLYHYPFSSYPPLY